MKECPVCTRCFPDHVNHCPGDGESLKFTLLGDTTLDGRYQLERRLGQGGMGVVFKARHIFLKTQHAVKIILPDLVGNDPSLATRFRQEAMAAAAIHHPNTINVTDFGIISGTTPFLVMEFVEGRSLHEILQQAGRLQPANALEIMLAVCAGVSAAHAQGIVHRDLKPLNILLKTGYAIGEGVKVLDFGLAKIKSGELLGSFVAAQTQGMMGSPFYMAPEQWSDEDIDVRADIYSLGVILYQMLAGDVPFKGNSIPAIMHKHLTQPPVPLGERGVAVPEAVEQAVRHALEKDPERRPQTVDEFRDELRAALASINRDGAADTAGMQTLQIGSPDTMGLARAQTFAAADQHSGVTPGTETVAETADVRADAPINAANDSATDPATDIARRETATPEAIGQATVAQIAEPPTNALSQPANSPHAVETSPGFAAERTAFQPEDGGAGLPAGETRQPGALSDSEDAFRTNRIPGEEAAALLEEQRRRAAIQETHEAEARAEREAQALADEQARRRQEEQQRQRREEQERAEREAAERAQREAAERETAERERREADASAREERDEATVLAPRDRRVPVAEETRAVPARETNAAGAPVASPSRIPVVIGAVVVALLVGIAALVFYLKGSTQTGQGNTASNVAGNTSAPHANTGASPANPNAGGVVTPVRAELVQLPGGAFQMGRDDVPEVSPRYPQSYLLWLYNQWPAHAASVGPFAIDRTEVTNAEYAEFVKATGHAPPADVWDGNAPKPGEELWPVRSVSYEDAQAFAAWRSQRDGVTYRLPTEEEWEYAARGGGATRLYPWGDQWADGRANVGTDAPRPVGSFADGQTPQGIQDMIGNVWEWTSTKASMYKGNNKTVLLDADREKVVTRGGSYKSRPDGDEPITATSRKWVAKDTRDPLLGFRLVRASGR